MNNQMQPEAGARYDSLVSSTLKGTLLIIGLGATLAVIGMADSKMIPMVLLIGALTSAVFILTKGTLTGKRYAQGARSRRSKMLPSVYSKNDSLDSECAR